MEILSKIGGDSPRSNDEICSLKLAEQGQWQQRTGNDFWKKAIWAASVLFYLLLQANYRPYKTQDLEYSDSLASDVDRQLLSKIIFSWSKVMSVTRTVMIAFNQHNGSLRLCGQLTEGQPSLPVTSGPWKVFWSLPRVVCLIALSPSAWGHLWEALNGPISVPSHLLSSFLSAASYAICHAVKKTRSKSTQS